ncbi:MAG: hypothetical protein G01um10148_38 [Parcubacteria group bacterium Gr01-1014_8]|nr:MAG: hypothetical protein G01um10148_38 [Parcubacteria group bacterium Gr01-1014_8]
MAKLLTAIGICFLLIAPMVSAAESTDLQSQIIALFQQIIQLQKDLVLKLTQEITKLQTQIANLQKQVAQTHRCTLVMPPSCSTALTVSYDSYNCVTGYACKPSTTTTQTTTGASCTYNGQIYAEGMTSEGGWTASTGVSLCLPSGICPNRTAVLPVFQCKGGQWLCTSYCPAGAPTQTSSSDPSNMPYNCKIWQTHGCSGYQRSYPGGPATWYTGMCVQSLPLPTPQCNQYF